MNQSPTIEHQVADLYPPFVAIRICTHAVDTYEDGQLQRLLVFVTDDEEAIAVPIPQETLSPDFEGDPVASLYEVAHFALSQEVTRQIRDAFQQHGAQI